jgi:hypothetical protein
VLSFSQPRRFSANYRAYDNCHYKKKRTETQQEDERIKYSSPHIFELSHYMYQQVVRWRAETILFFFNKNKLYSKYRPAWLLIYFFVLFCLDVCF